VSTCGRCRLQGESSRLEKLDQLHKERLQHYSVLVLPTAACAARGVRMLRLSPCACLRCLRRRRRTPRRATTTSILAMARGNTGAQACSRCAVPVPLIASCACAWLPRKRAQEMLKTAELALTATKQNYGKHFIGDFLPKEEVRLRAACCVLRQCCSAALCYC
jgi:hypothetical protein